MSCLSWNCQGLGAALTKKALNDLCKKHKPSIVFLMETRMKSNKLEKVRRKCFGAGSMWYVDPIGSSGGLALWWKFPFELEILDASKNYIVVNLRKGPEGTWGVVTFIYGAPKEQDRGDVWQEVRKFDPGDGIPWVCLGDMNDILEGGEKSGGRIRSESSLSAFQEFVFDGKLIDIGFKGSRFTWANNQLGNHLIKERLDRGLCNVCWRSLPPNGIVKHLDFVGSDHCPILLCFNPSEKKTPWSFKFESMWTSHEEYKVVVCDNWGVKNDTSLNVLANFSANLDFMRSVLTKWSKDTFPNNRKVIDDLLRELNQCREDVWDEDSRSKMNSIAKQIEEMWDREEAYWMQRSRIQWLRNGDKNSGFFHSTTVQRRVKNKVSRICNGDGIWLEKEEDIASCFSSFFKDLFKASGGRDFGDVLSCIDCIVNDEDNASLCRPITDLEVKDAVFQLGGMKAPGPDGFSGCFYQHSWDTVSSQMCDLVRVFFNGNVELRDLNATNIVLIPKVDNLEVVGSFRPISLCNFSYKVISKVISNRMRGIMPKLISENQRAFVPGRLIQDNILVVHEAFHYLKSKKKGKVAELAIKLDMNKVYDRVEWDFLAQVLLKLGFCEQWVLKIMQCIDSVSFRLLLSGKKVADFKPLRGLRQGIHYLPTYSS